MQLHSKIYELHERYNLCTGFKWITLKMLPLQSHSYRATILIFRRQNIVPHTLNAVFESDIWNANAFCRNNATTMLLSLVAHPHLFFPYKHTCTHTHTLKHAYLLGVVMGTIQCYKPILDPTLHYGYSQRNRKNCIPEQHTVQHARGKKTHNNFSFLRKYSRILI